MRKGKESKYKTRQGNNLKERRCTDRQGKVVKARTNEEWRSNGKDGKRDITTTIVKVSPTRYSVAATCVVRRIGGAMPF